MTSEIDQHSLPLSSLLTHRSLMCWLVRVQGLCARIRLTVSKALSLAGDEPRVKPLLYQDFRCSSVRPPCVLLL